MALTKNTTVVMCGARVAAVTCAQFEIVDPLSGLYRRTVTVRCGSILLETSDFISRQLSDNSAALTEPFLLQI